MQKADFASFFVSMPYAKTKGALNSLRKLSPLYKSSATTNGTLIVANSVNI